METKFTKQDKIALIAAAFDLVYTDEEKFVEDLAKEHAIVNMGQELDDFVRAGMTPETLVSRCYNDFYHSSESDEMADGLAEEKNHFRKDAKRQLAMIKKKGLPLTFDLARDAFLNKGVFTGTKVKR